MSDDQRIKYILDTLVRIDKKLGSIDERLYRIERIINSNNNGETTDYLFEEESELTRDIIRIADGYVGQYSIKRDTE
ncbi:hypothetical protein SAMN04487770_102135 [Butyrivibrio sp. ob235]|uniref:hypothetical protein n=1 Tax=Butyrivibrio sp. ob235 TaxID=1761780 RepID=UPI0008D30612|nr:hypothetical protein [Butyrivibrio sp. ob235]SEK63529.1 hypothetical protein SAMN04487770_102135 [Butyrivibrio sp. ob235]